MTKFTLPIQYDQFIVLSYTTCIFAQKCPSKYRQIILFSTYIASPRVLLLWYGSFKKCLWIKSLNSRRIAAILILFIQVLLWFFYHCLILRKPKIKYVHQLDSSLSSYFRIYYYLIKINSYIQAIGNSIQNYCNSNSNSGQKSYWILQYAIIDPQKFYCNNAINAIMQYLF